MTFSSEDSDFKLPLQADENGAMVKIILRRSAEEVLQVEDIVRVCPWGIARLASVRELGGVS